MSSECEVYWYFLPMLQEEQPPAKRVPIEALLLDEMETIEAEQDRIAGEVIDEILREAKEADELRKAARCAR